MTNKIKCSDNNVFLLRIRAEYLLDKFSASHVTYSFQNLYNNLQQVYCSSHTILLLLKEIKREKRKKERKKESNKEGRKEGRKEGKKNDREQTSHSWWLAVQILMALDLHVYNRLSVHHVTIVFNGKCISFK